MDDDKKALLEAWVRKWERAAPLLQAQRGSEIRASSPGEAIEALSDAFEYALASTPPSTTSGLVDYQKALKKLRQ